MTLDRVFIDIESMAPGAEPVGKVEAVLQAARSGMDSATKLSIGALIGAALTLNSERTGSNRRGRDGGEPFLPIAPEKSKRVGELFEAFLEDQPWPRKGARSAILLLFATNGELLIERMRPAVGDERGVERLKDSREIASRLAAGSFSMHSDAIRWEQSSSERHVRWLGIEFMNDSTYFHIQAIARSYIRPESSWVVALGIAFDEPWQVNDSIRHWHGSQIWTWRHLCDRLAQYLR